tara:strand:- start:50 stop:1363 length:1314 start_codon:yes stop_codon:yes gene_type:complete
MGGMFLTSKFNQDIGSWNVSKVISMYLMFGNSPFNQNISSWNVSNVENMSSMFSNATAFNQNLGSWDYTKVTNISNMFYNTGLTYTTYSAFIRDLATSNTISNVDFTLIGIYRINDTATNTAYTQLTVTNEVTFNDGGAFALADLQNMYNIVYPKIIMNISNNGGSKTIPYTDEYTIITDSGDTNKAYGPNESLSYTVNIIHGVSLSITNLLLTSNDTLKIYNSSVTGTLLYDNSGNNSAIIDLTNINSLHIVFTSDNSVQTQGFILVLKLIPVLSGQVCFREGSNVMTDQGLISIDKLDRSIHTIRKREIKHITQTVTKQKELVQVNKNSLGKNIPCEDTVMSQEHLILYQGITLPIKNLVYIPGVKYIENTGEVLYNVLLDNHELMIVNNMVVETLHPKNIISKIYTRTDGLSNKEKSLVFKEFNDQIIRRHVYQ